MGGQKPWSLGEVEKETTGLWCLASAAEKEKPWRTAHAPTVDMGYKKPRARQGRKRMLGKEDEGLQALGMPKGRGAFSAGGLSYATGYKKPRQGRQGRAQAAGRGVWEEDDNEVMVVDW